MRIKLKNKFILSFPLPRVHLGIPTGNSDSGFLVFGEGKELKICFSLASCWDRRNDQVLEKPCPYDELIRLFDPCSVDPINDKLRQSANEFRQWTDNFWWPSSRIAGGRVVLHLRGEIFSLTLDYNSGMISASARSGTIQLLASLHQNALIIRDPNHLILRRFFHPASEYLQSIYVKAGISPAELFHDGCFQPLPSDPGTLAWFSGDQLNLALREDTSLPETPREE